jgi:hypothetical protein
VDKAHLTAITRSKLSAPTKLLWSSGELSTPVLDYGCGKGFDADKLGFDKYDPYYFPDKPRKKYKTVICNYVLNVLPVEQEARVLHNIEKYMANDSVAFITVRRDVKVDGLTKRGTYQRNVVLDLPTVYKNGSYEIYRMTR